MKSMIHISADLVMSACELTIYRLQQEMDERHEQRIEELVKSRKFWHWHIKTHGDAERFLENNDSYQFAVSVRGNQIDRLYDLWEMAEHAKDDTMILCQDDFGELAKAIKELDREEVKHPYSIDHHDTAGASENL